MMKYYITQEMDCDNKDMKTKLNRATIVGQRVTYAYIQRNKDKDNKEMKESNQAS